VPLLNIGDVDNDDKGKNRPTTSMHKAGKDMIFDGFESKVYQSEDGDDDKDDHYREAKDAGELFDDDQTSSD
jgi:hypothetical protein